VGPGDVFLATLPWFHIYGMVIVMHAGLYRGVKLVALPSFDLASYLRLTQVRPALPCSARNGARVYSRVHHCARACRSTG
jgi:acyl-CoA synthetase (AMP-forming)/AMP-acid ligase II